MERIMKALALVVLVIIIVLTYIGTSEAGGPWNNQYCDIKTKHIKVVDTDGNLVEEKVEETVICEDGVKDFLHGYGIADSCQMFTWQMPLGEVLVEQRAIACHKMDGGYEIVKGYHSGH
tara:strand:+ start:1912 stop:2268 length:357 start_codon:yes stop_codon:yes gene_type:complete